MKSHEVTESGFYWVRQIASMGMTVMEFRADRTYTRLNGDRWGGWEGMGRDDGGDWQIAEVVCRIPEP